MPSRAEAAILILLSLAMCGQSAAPRRITVPAGGSVAAAVRSARNGDTVWLSAGTYREPTIVLGRSIVLTGDSGAVIDGGRATDIVRIEGNDVTVRGLSFQNVLPSHVEDRAAVRVGEVQRCRIEGNRIDNSFFGIYLAGARSCGITRNVVTGRRATEDSAGNGIHLWTARDIDVSHNEVSGHRDGIYLEFTHDTRVTGNTSARNVRYGLHFMYSDACRYEANVFRGNEAGVAVMYTRQVFMKGNRFESSWGSAAYGLLLKEVYDATLDGNSFTGNTTGLVADGATRLVARANVFANNGWAVKILASTQDASFRDNVFASNTFDVVTNSRQTTSRFEGNYWDEYRGYDLDRDGTGDVPHRPVRLFSMIVAANEPALVFLRSPISSVLDAAERAFPTLTPETLADASPRMRRPR